MKRATTFLLASILLARCAFAVAADPTTQPTLESPRLAKLAAQIDHGDTAALDQFWKSLAGHTPLVEPIANDPHTSLVTFLYKGDDQTPNQPMLLIGGPPQRVFDKPLSRLGQTNIYYRTAHIPNDARFSYFFQGKWPDDYARDKNTLAALEKRYPVIPDPLNPHQAKRPGWGSLVELSEAPPEPWMTRAPGIERGQVENRSLKSAILREGQFFPITTAQTRVFDLYTPPHFDADAQPRYPLLILFDGTGYKDDGEFPVATILDNLIAEKKIPPLVACFVYQTKDRNKELGCFDPFADFVATELVPWLRKNAHAADDPAHTIISGLSLGGLMSSYCAYRHPEVFSNVISLSGSYQWYPEMLTDTLDHPTTGGWLPEQFVSLPRRPTRFFLAAGKFEHFWPHSLLEENRRLRDILTARGDEVHYREFTGGHDPTGWRGPFVEGLITLTQSPK